MSQNQGVRPQRKVNPLLATGWVYHDRDLNSISGYVWTCAHRCRCHWRPAGLDPPGAGVTCACELPCGCWQLSSSLLKSSVCFQLPSYLSHCQCFLKIKLYVHTLFVLIIIKANPHLHNCDYFYNIKENSCVCCIFFEGMGSELFKTCLEEGV